MSPDTPSSRAIELYRTLPFADRKAVDALLEPDDLARLKDALALSSLEADARKLPETKEAPAMPEPAVTCSDWLEARLAAAGSGTDLPGETLTPATQACLADLLGRSDTRAD